MGSMGGGTVGTKRGERGCSVSYLRVRIFLVFEKKMF